MTETARDLDLTYASPTVFRLAKAVIALEERVAALERKFVTTGDRLVVDIAPEMKGKGPTSSGVASVMVKNWSRDDD